MDPHSDSRDAASDDAAVTTCVLQVRLVSGESVDVTIRSTDTVRQLHKNAAHQLGIVGDKLRLTCGGRLLDFQEPAIALFGQIVEAVLVNLPLKEAFEVL